MLSAAAVAATAETNPLLEAERVVAIAVGTFLMHVLGIVPADDAVCLLIRHLFAMQTLVPSRVECAPLDK